ncbi:MAG: hypothetical protein ACREP7_21430, partial [Lysobacter sp.]
PMRETLAIDWNDAGERDLPNRITIFPFSDSTLAARNVFRYAPACDARKRFDSVRSGGSISSFGLCKASPLVGRSAPIIVEAKNAAIARIKFRMQAIDK